MKVLIVDDEQHVREGIKLLGEWDRLGVTELLEAANGQVAIEQIKRFQPEIVLTDIKMPEMDGMDLLKWIYDEKRNIKTVLITGYDEYGYMRKAIQYKSSDYILKPVDPEALNQTIEKTILLLKEEQNPYNIQMDQIQPKKEIKTIQLVEQYIQQHYLREVSLQEIADRFFISREYISRKFKQEYGQNLSDYLTNVRMDKAKQLLSDPNIKIYEVAHRIGYEDDKYFRKLFKKKVGVTPNEYRKSAK
ncbi:response regulator transcription factor [Peribacillus tepidiphilus]|jgi:two-component system, response regulator YesN|uniref:response regulator transcription factor n=1 Tax=Peribacillus tepidiphilus TaxID=2652445 RepID=UPI0035B4FDAF